MKHVSKLILLSFAAVLLFQSCKKKKEDTEEFSQAIQNIVPDSLIARFQAAGIEINAGMNPPVINGIYMANPVNTVYDNSGTAGATISDYKYKFYDQNNGNLTVKLDYKAMNYSDAASGAGAYLSGANGKFTAFVESAGQAQGISYKVLSIFSGEATAQGLKGFKHAVYVKEKGNDPNNYLSPVGTLRIFKDGNSLAETTGTY
ncbi:MAG: hypothetical protein ACO1NX_07780 [Chitinophagaceae bacterium]